MNQNYKKGDASEIYESVLAGENQRAELLCYIFAAAFVLYGLSSYQFIVKFSPSMGLYENIYPRFFLNGLPLFFLGRFLRKTNRSEKQKALVWTILFPVIFCSACLIYVWLLIYQGNSELYYYVHGTIHRFLCFF